MFGVWHVSCLCPVSGAAFQQNDTADGNWAFHCTNGEWDTNPYTLSLRWLRFVGRGSTNAQVLTSVVKDPLHRHRHLRSSPGFKPRWVGHSPQESEQHRTRTRGHLNLQPLLCFVKWPPLTACSFCSNRYGPVGGSHFHWCGVYVLLYNGRWLRQFKSF